MYLQNEKLRKFVTCNSNFEKLFLQKTVTKLRLSQVLNQLVITYSYRVIVRQIDFYEGQTDGQTDRSPDRQTDITDDNIYFHKKRRKRVNKLINLCC